MIQKVMTLINRWKEKIIENIKFLEKASKDKQIKVNDLWEICQNDAISSMTLTRILIELEKQGSILYAKSGIFMFIDCKEVKT
jgi:hypothetical protein